MAAALVAGIWSLCIGSVAAGAQTESGQDTSVDGLYWGIAAGVSRPTGQFHGGYRSGWNVTAPLGWDFDSSPLGIRVDGSYDRVSGRTIGGSELPDAGIWSLNGDAKLRMQLRNLRAMRAAYVLAGVGAHRIVGGATTSSGGYGTSLGDASTSWGWNAGAGIAFGWGRASMFLEWRYLSVSPNGQLSEEAPRLIPIILGFTF
jgi:Outer membrane protein beta-barrel domain